MRIAALLLALPLITAACSASRPGSPPADPAVAEYGRLDLVKATQRIEGDRMFLDLTVRNSFSEPVNGVRVLFRLLVSKDPESMEIVRAQEVTDDVLAPGAETKIPLALPRQAGQRGTFGTFVHAFAVMRGGTSLPTPPEWRDEAP
jgi:hypothetical protein